MYQHLHQAREEAAVTTNAFWKVKNTPSKSKKKKLTFKNFEPNISPFYKDLMEQNKAAQKRIAMRGNTK